MSLKVYSNGKYPITRTDEVLKPVLKEPCKKELHEKMIEVSNKVLSEKENYSRFDSLKEAREIGYLGNNVSIAKLYLAIDDFSRKKENFIFKAITIQKDDRIDLEKSVQDFDNLHERTLISFFKKTNIYDPMYRPLLEKLFQSLKNKIDEHNLDSVKDSLNQVFLLALKYNIKFIYEYCLDKVDLTIKCEAGRNALMYAAMGGCTDVIEHLIKKGFEINQKTFHDEGPLFYAATRGHLKTCERLIELGANVNGIKGIVRPSILMQTARHHQVEVFELLMEKGADPHCKGYFEETALSYVSLNRELTLLKREERNDVNNLKIEEIEERSNKICKIILLKNRASNLEKDNALINAVKGRYYQVSKTLLEAGADVDVCDEYGVSVFQRAKDEGDKEIIELLSGYKK